jgi:glycosidase
MYLITPDRFVNGDPNNDSVPSLKESVNRNDITGRHGGDLEGIRRSIDYIDQMGFTAIWLNPVLENNQEKYSYHGYSTTDFYKVDERFGSNEDYRSLTKAARNKNIKMIMDMILNHCGSDHWWMEDLPTTDWINFNNTFQVTNHKRTTVQDQYASSYDKKYFADGWFVKTMPDLNQRNPLFATYLIQNTLWWIEYSGLAGIRMDTYPYPDKDFMTHWTKRVMEEYPNFNIVGEEWSTNPAIVSFWQAGKENHNKYISYLPSVMDFPIQHALVNALKEEESWSDGWQKLYEMLALDFLYPDPDNLVVFTDNHDMSRFFTQIDEDISLFKLGMAYLLTIRGIPQIYYGTEILMNNASSPDHGVIRSDFPGGWEEDTINVFNNAGLNTEQVEAQNFLRKLLHWRKTASAIHNGKLMHFAPYKGVYVLFRYSAMDKVMIVLNKNREAVELDLDRYAEILDDHVRASDIITEKEYILKKGGKLFAPARTPLILDFTP